MTYTVGPSTTRSRSHHHQSIGCQIAVRTATVTEIADSSFLRFASPRLTSPLAFCVYGRSRDVAANTATILSIQGRQHPVDILYTEKPANNYIQAAVDAALAVHASEPIGDILIFLPGAEEIDDAVEVLRDHAPAAGGSGRWGTSTAKGGTGEGDSLQVLPFYSALPVNMQMKVFEPTRAGVRRVVVATNIAETSVTIDGIRYVIDSGVTRLPIYDPAKGFGSLVTTLTSKASAKQRAGRAGRVAPGKCLRLMTEEHYYDLLPAQTVPEMQRSDLSWVVLLLKALGVDDILHFDFLSPPAAETMIRALELLYALGALDEACRLTDPLGMTMAEFPVEPCVAKFLVSAWDFDCIEVKLVGRICVIVCRNKGYCPVGHLLRVMSTHIL